MTLPPRMIQITPHSLYHWHPEKSVSSARSDSPTSPVKTGWKMTVLETFWRCSDSPSDMRFKADRRSGSVVATEMVRARDVRWVRIGSCGISSFGNNGLGAIV